MLLSFGQSTHRKRLWFYHIVKASCIYMYIYYSPDLFKQTIMNFSCETIHKESSTEILRMRADLTETCYNDTILKYLLIINFPLLILLVIIIIIIIIFGFIKKN